MKDRKGTAVISSSDVDELIGRFERSMIYDCHSFTARFSRSDARRELARRGAAVLDAIAAHLRKSPPSDKFDVRTAWGLLLHQIEISVDPKQSGPQKFKDTEGWITWAERFADRAQQKGPDRTNLTAER